MTILSTDIKLLASERMTDTSDGGGRRTSNVIPDGVAGNIFPKVSRLDSVYGRVNMRKVFAHVDTQNVETYAGAHVALIDDADNNKIKVNIFTSGSDFDARSNARDYIESFVVSGPESRMWLYGRQLAGQQAITCMQRVEDTLPEVGDVYCLSFESAGVITYQQYVRVEDVQHEIRTFTDTGGDYLRRIVTLKLGATLRYEFVGVEEATRVSNAQRQSIIRTTNFADAARYFGLSRLAEVAPADSLEIKVDTIYSNIVPTTQRESAVSNAQIAGAAQLVAAGTTPTTYRAVAFAPASGAMAVYTSTFNVGQTIAPGTLELYVSEQTGSLGNNKTVPVKDDGAGVIPAGIPFEGTGYQVLGGEIDYETGVVTCTWRYGNGGLGGAVYARSIPAAAATQIAHVYELPVTLNTRGTVHVVNLRPLPARGSLQIDFRALGKWYRLRDDGTGRIVGGDASYGTGSVDYVSGAVVVTLGALPDIGSSTLFAWASPAHYEIKAGPAVDADNAVRQTFVVLDVPVKPGTMTVKYTSGAVEYTATADAGGVIGGGDVVGTVNHTTGEVVIAYSTRLPDPSSQLTVNYQQNLPADPNFPTHASGVANLVGGVRTFATVSNLKPFSVTVRAKFKVGTYVGGLSDTPAILHDNGAGKLFTTQQMVQIDGGVYDIVDGQEVGTVDYTSGDIALYDVDFEMRKNQFFYWSGGWSAAHELPGMFVDSEYSWEVSLDNAAVASAKVASISCVERPLTLDLLKTSISEMVPGTLTFVAFGKAYFERNGALYHSMGSDGAGTAAGSVDYGTGEVTLTDYTQAAPLGLTVTSCLTKYGNFDFVETTFRTAGSPLRPASTFVQVTARDGQVLTATCDESGDITGDLVRGHVNQQFGLVHIEWGQMVAAAGNETEPWFDADNVVGANVWKPLEVMPETLRYSTVVLTNLPVNADVLGLDPVRLPSDGRVPILRAGDVVMIHNTKSTNLPNPVLPGGMYAVGRANLADIVLSDANGVTVPMNQYVFDLAAGTVTMAADMNLGALVQPLVARHRVEELNMATDAQINGQVSLAAPTSRAFDEDTRVSGCLLFGDLFARVTNVFDQVTWTGEWSDLRIGANGTSEYNTVNFPIEVRNDGAVTERWRINFTGPTSYQVIGENLGVIASGTTAGDCSPVNLLTGEPYFTIRAGGWGAGWAVGQQLRFNTNGATGSIWMVRTVLPGAALTGDSIDIQLRGDVDA